MSDLREYVNPGISGGVRTLHTDGRPVTFHNPSGRLLLTVDIDGRLVIAPGVTKDTASRQVADMILHYFGKAYGSALVAAEAAEEHARSQTRRMTSERNDWKARAEKAERTLAELKERGVMW